MSTRVTLLSAKGTFGQSASKNVSVHMKDVLPGVCARVEDESEIAVRVFAGYIVGDGHHFCEKLRVARGEFNDIRIRLGLWNDQDVYRSPWRDVTERDDRVRFENDVGRNVAGDDGGKNTH